MEKIGFEKLKLRCINPSEEYILTYFRELEEEEFDYIYFKKDEWVLLHFYFETQSGDILKHCIKLENKIHTNYYINQVADYQKVKDESQLFESFKIFQKGENWNDITKRFENYKYIGDKIYKIPLIGEIELMNLIRSFKDLSIYDKSTNYFIDINNLFNGDFLELIELFTSERPFTLIGLLEYKDGIIQLNKRFLPIGMYNSFNTNIFSSYYKKLYNEFKTNLKEVNENYYYLLQFSILFNQSMLPKKKIIIDTEPIY